MFELPCRPRFLSQVAEALHSCTVISHPENPLRGLTSRRSTSPRASTAILWKENIADDARTFKYVHGSTTLDLKRAPAYTDRILWTTPIPPTQRGTPLLGAPTVASPGASTSPGPAMSTSSSVASLPRSASSGGITRSTSQSTISGLVPRNWPVDAQSYSSHEILWSDHRPVSAVVQTEVRSVDVEKRAECLTKATNEVDKLEEIYRPALDSETNVDFGPVR
jgi:hypothetical protein